MKPFIYITCIVFLVSCSGRKSSYSDLEHIDSLMQQNTLFSADSNRDSIAAILSERKENRWYNKKDEAYFNLLYAINAVEREAGNPENIDSLLNLSLDYYKETATDHDKLARTYLYKGKLDKLMLEDRTAAMSNLKAAEAIAVKLHDKSIQHDVYDLMFQTYYDINDNETAKTYALKTYETACDLGSDKLKAYALLNLASVCQSLGEKKECYDYAMQMEPLLYACGKSSLPYILNTIGTVVFNTTNDYEQAKKYFNKSLAERPVPVTYGIIAQVEMAMDNPSEAEQMWLKALALTDDDKNVRMPDANLFALNGMYKFQKSIGQYDRACEYLEQIVAVKDSLNIAHQGEAVQEIAAKYDKEVEKNQLNRKIIHSIIIITCLILIVMALIAYMRFRAHKAKLKLMENQFMITSLRKQINELETSGSNNEKEVDRLKGRITDLEENQAETLHHGHQLYSMITNGGTVSTWKQRDFVDFIEYYKMIDLPFVLHLQHDYDRLSSRNQFFEILYHIGFTDNEVKHTLGIGQSTIRTTRTRIKQRKKPNASED